MSIIGLRGRIPIAFVGMWLVAGCVANGFQPGELGNGSFFWVCTAAADPACDEAGEVADPFPERVALGSRFRLRYEANFFDGGDGLPVRSGSSRLEHRTSSGGFTATTAGFASVVVYREGQLWDYLHLDVREAEVALRGGVGSGGLLVNDTATVRMDATCDGQPCAGTFPYQWVVDRPEILWLREPLYGGDSVVIEGLSPGEANIHLVNEVVVATLPVTVVAEEVPLPTASTADTATTTVATGDTGSTP